MVEENVTDVLGLDGSTALGASNDGAAATAELGPDGRPLAVDELPTAATDGIPVPLLALAAALPAAVLLVGSRLSPLREAGGWPVPGRRRRLGT